MSDNLKFISKEEIDKLPDYKKQRRIRDIYLVVFLIVVLIGIALILCGSLIKGLEETASILLIVFGGILLFFDLIILFFGLNIITKDNKLRKELFNQALKEELGVNTFYDPSPKISKLFLKESGISPLDVKEIKNQIVTSFDKKKVSVFECKSENPLVNNSIGVVSSTIQAGPIGALVGVGSVINSISNKETVSRMFDGTIILVTNLNKKVEGLIEVRSNKFSTPKSFNLSKEDRFEVESIDANDSYSFYSKIKDEAYYVVTPQRILELNELNNKINKPITMLFKENYLVIAINDYHLDIDKNYCSKNISTKEMYYELKQKLNCLKEIDNLFSFDKM